MRKKDASSYKKKKFNLPLPMTNSSKTLNKSELSTANFCIPMPSKAGSSSLRSKSIARTSRRREISSIMKKPWYFIIYPEPNQEGRRRGEKKEGRRKAEAQEVLEKPEKATQTSC